MQTVDKRHVIANGIGRWCEEMTGLNHNVDGLIGVTEQRDAGVARDGFLPPLECAGLTIGLHRRDEFFRHLLGVLKVTLRPRGLVRANVIARNRDILIGNMKEFAIKIDGQARIGGAPPFAEACHLFLIATCSSGGVLK